MPEVDGKRSVVKVKAIFFGETGIGKTSTEDSRVLNATSLNKNPTEKRKGKKGQTKQKKKKKKNTVEDYVQNVKTLQKAFAVAESDTSQGLKTETQIAFNPR